MAQRIPFVKIPLTHGKVALVSPEDAERVLQFKWHAHKRIRYGKVRYMARGIFFVDGVKTRQALHRFVLEFKPGDPMVDHRNGNDLDCRRGNLREATDSQSLANRRKRSDASSPYKGIEKHRRKWRAVIYKDGKPSRLGLFETPEEAARDYDKAARRLYGEFACVNFPIGLERRAR